MHEIGFEVVTKKKVTFVDGHEREDVVEHHTKFLWQMVSLGFLNPNNTPTEEARDALPSYIGTPNADVINKTIVLFHDQTTFQANEDQPTLWAAKGTKVMLPKLQGSGIMVPNFISEMQGYLQLTEEEYQETKKNNPRIWKYGCQTLEHGEAKEGYWTSDKFMSQIMDAVAIAEVKYPRAKGGNCVGF